MLKFKLNLILQFVSYEVIMPRNIFLDHSPFFFCPHMRFFINPLTLILLNKRKWLSVRTVFCCLPWLLLRRHGWNPIFSKPFNDWEVEEAERLLYGLGRYTLEEEAADEVRWKLTKAGVFTVKSMYKAL